MANAERMRLEYEPDLLTTKLSTRLRQLQTFATKEAAAAKLFSQMGEKTGVEEIKYRILGDAVHHIVKYAPISVVAPGEASAIWLCEVYQVNDECLSVLDEEIAVRTRDIGIQLLTVTSDYDLPNEFNRIADFDRSHLCDIEQELNGSRKYASPVKVILGEGANQLMTVQADYIKYLALGATMLDLPVPTELLGATE